MSDFMEVFIPDIFSQNFNRDDFIRELNAPGNEPRKRFFLNELLLQFINSRLSSSSEYPEDYCLNLLLEFFEADYVLSQLLERLFLVFIPQRKISVNFQMIDNLVSVVKRSTNISPNNKYNFFYSVQQYIADHINAMGWGVSKEGIKQLYEEINARLRNLLN